MTAKEKAKQIEYIIDGADFEKFYNGKLLDYLSGIGYHTAEEVEEDIINLFNLEDDK